MRPSLVVRHTKKQVAYQLSGQICPKHLSSHGVKQVGRLVDWSNVLSPAQHRRRAAS